MDVTWILVADRDRARLFAREPGRDALEEIADYFNQGHEPAVELLQSMTRSRGKLIHHAAQPVRDERAATFAGELAAALARGLQNDCYAQLVLIAPARFLAALHGVMDARVRERIAYEVDEDLTLTSARDIRAYLRPRRPRLASAGLAIAK